MRNPILDACRSEPERIWTFLHSSTGGNICRYPEATNKQLTQARRVLIRLERLKGK